MMKKNNSNIALKAGSWYIMSNFLLKGIAIITIPIFTRLLPPESFGIVNTYGSWLGILTVIGTLDIYSCVQIGSYDFEESEMQSFVASIVTLSSISVVVLYIFIKVLNFNNISITGLPPLLDDLMFLEILFFNAYTISQAQNRATFKYKKFVLFSLIIAFLSPLLSIFIINFLTENLYYGKIIGAAIPKLLVSIIIYYSIIRKKGFVINRRYWKYALLISIPLIPHHLAGNILNHFDKIMISKLVGDVSTGLYSLAYSYTSILSVTWTSFNQAWVPWFYSKMKTEDYSDIKKYVMPYITVFTLMFFVLMTMGPEAIKLFGPRLYWEGKWVIPPVLLGIFFQFIYSLYVNIEYYHKKTHYIAIGTIFAALINVLLNYMFIPKYGYIAAGYTTLVGYTILFAMHYMISKRWNSKDIFSNRTILAWIILIILYTTIILIFYNNAIVRYLILVIIFLLYISKTQSIIKAYMSVKRRL